MARTTARREGNREADLHRDTADLHAALTDLIRVYQFRDRERICCHDLSVTQFYAIAALAANGPLTLNDLAAELYLEKSSASRVVDGLVAKGYVDRRTHPDDRRAVLIAATPGGSRIHERIVAGMIEEEKALLANFEPQVRRAMTGLIERLARAAAARVETGAGGRCRLAD